MPVSEYFHGGGEKAMKNMKQEYGEKKGKQVFYATANKTGAKPGGSPQKTKRLETLGPGRGRK